MKTNTMISTKAEFVVSASIQLCAAILIQDKLDQSNPDSEYYGNSFSNIADDAISSAEQLWEELVSRGYLSPDRPEFKQVNIH